MPKRRKLPRDVFVKAIYVCAKKKNRGVELIYVGRKQVHTFKMRPLRDANKRCAWSIMWASRSFLNRAMYRTTPTGSTAFTTILSIVLFTKNTAVGGRGAQNVSTISRSFAGAITTKENYKSTGCMLEVNVSSSHVSCTQACLMHTRCVSTNYESASRLCQLNHCRAGDTAELNGVLRYQQGFVYSEYLREVSLTWQYQLLQYRSSHYEW